MATQTAVTKSPSTLGKGNPLWDFATWAYAQAGVEKACLALQNRLGADVNVLMFCLWLAQRGTAGGQLARYLGAAIKLSRDWQRNFVEPLRTCRTNFKEFVEATAMGGLELAAAHALRERIKQCELDMEQAQVLAMYALVMDNDVIDELRSSTEQKQDAQNNLNVYFSATGVKLDPLGQTHVIRILTAVFG